MPPYKFWKGNLPQEIQGHFNKNHEDTTIIICKLQNYVCVLNTLCVQTAGVIVGVILRYAVGTSDIQQFIFSKPFDVSSCSKEIELEIGEIIQISSYNVDSGDGDSFLCSIDGKLFQDRERNYITQTVSF